MVASHKKTKINSCKHISSMALWVRSTGADYTNRHKMKGGFNLHAPKKMCQQTDFVFLQHLWKKSKKGNQFVCIQRKKKVFIVKTNPCAVIHYSQCLSNQLFFFMVLHWHCTKKEKNVQPSYKPKTATKLSCEGQKHALNWVYIVCFF